MTPRSHRALVLSLVLPALAIPLLSVHCGRRPLAAGTHRGMFADDDAGQVDAAPPPEDALGAEPGSCPTGMVAVAGRMLVSVGQAVEALQDGTCTQWLENPEPDHIPPRCAAFDRDAWLRKTSKFPKRHLAFCIDRFEYPNQRGKRPIVETTWHEAEQLCGRESKRLCTEDEWTFACEGEEATPYPNGYVRDEEGCVMDRPHLEVHEDILARKDTPAARAEVERLWQGELSGSRPKCKSSFGVYDLPGNVDEWTAASPESEHPSVLKGGYWGPVRARCRPATRAHGEDYASYQSGFRCCRSEDVEAGSGK